MRPREEKEQVMKKLEKKPAAAFAALVTLAAVAGCEPVEPRDRVHADVTAQNDTIVLAQQITHDAVVDLSRAFYVDANAPREGGPMDHESSAAPGTLSSGGTLESTAAARDLGEIDDVRDLQESEATARGDGPRPPLETPVDDTARTKAKTVPKAALPSAPPEQR